MLLNLVVLWTAAFGALLAGAILMLDWWVSPKWACRLPIIVSGVVALGAVVAWGARAEPHWAWGGIALAAMFATAWVVTQEWFRRNVHRLLAPRVVWALALVASLATVRYLAAHLVWADQAASPAVVDLRDAPVDNVYALTDQGRVITLFHYEMFTPPAETEALILSADIYRNGVVRLAECNSVCNCHGWVFAEGRFGIRNPDVPLILKDNGYVEVQDVREGDLAIYVNGMDVTHSGVVRYVGGGKVVIESKWGPFGTFLHRMETQPFSGICRFYRSPRRGHALAIESTASPRGIDLPAITARWVQEAMSQSE